MKLTATALIANILDKLDKTSRYVLNEHFKLINFYREEKSAVTNHRLRIDHTISQKKNKN